MGLCSLVCYFGFDRDLKADPGGSGRIRFICRSDIWIKTAGNIRNKMKYFAGIQLFYEEAFIDI